MATKPTEKWFIVAQSGTTVDQREIKPEWLEQCAKNYDPATYGARINLEHVKFRYYDPKEAHSKSYGDVIELKTQTTENAVQLLARIDPTPELVELVNSRQKIYSSVEICTNFADTCEAYLVGLAVTDTPASLGTEALKFSKDDNSEVFTAHFENAEIFTDQKAEENKEAMETQTQTHEPVEIVEANANSADEQNSLVALVLQTAEFEELKTTITAQAEEIKNLSAKLNQLNTTLEELRKIPANEFKNNQVTGADHQSFIF